MAQTRRRPKRGSTANRSDNGDTSNGNGQRRGDRPGDARHFRMHFETKVWHDPLLKATRSTVPDPPAVVVAEAVRPEPHPPERRSVRIIAGPKPPTDPREVTRQRLYARVLAAEGRPLISSAVDEYFKEGFELPRTQEAWLQLLEHRDETKVGDAIGALRAILEEVMPERRAVLESRLRRIEELAEERSTQAAARDLRRFLNAKEAAAAAARAALRPSDDESFDEAL